MRRRHTRSARYGGIRAWRTDGPETALHPLDLALLDEDLEAFAREVLHEGLRVECLGHHHAAFLDLAGDKQPRGEGGRDAGLDDRERVAPFFVGVAVAVHGVNEVL